MQSETARRRRALFHRSLTLPTDYIHEEGEEPPTEQSKLLASSEMIAEAPPDPAVDSENDSDNQSPQFKSTARQTKRVKLQRSHTMAAGDNRPLLPKHEGVELKHGADASRATSAPSNLLSKVKERIKQKVIQSTEWPNAAAIVQERRQRALDALEATLSGGSYKGVDIIPLRDMSNKDMKRRLQTRSETVTKEAMASTSGQCSGGQPRPGGSRRSASDSSNVRQCFNGIVCSDEDLKSILKDYKVQKKPAVQKPYKRTQSLDCGRMQELLAQSQISHESTSSGASMLSEDADPFGDNNQPSNGDQKSPTNAPQQEQKPDQGERKRPNITLTLREYSQLTSTDGSIEIAEEETADPNNQAPPPAEVIFDEHGQTWDVYGAEFDPEILGIAIQKHLDHLISGPIRQESRDENGNEERRETDPVTAAAAAAAAQQETGFWNKLLCLFRRRRGSNM